MGPRGRIILLLNRPLASNHGISTSNKSYRVRDIHLYGLFCWQLRSLLMDCLLSCWLEDTQDDSAIDACVLRPYNKSTSQSWLQNYCTHPLLGGGLCRQLIDNELKHYFVAVYVMYCIRHSRLPMKYLTVQMTIYSILFCRDMVTYFMNYY